MLFWFIFELNLKAIYSSLNFCIHVPCEIGNSFTYEKKNEKTLWPLFKDGFQLPQGYCHFDEAVYFLPLSFQIFLVLILSTSEGWKVEWTLELPSRFEHGTPGLEIQCLRGIEKVPLFALTNVYLNTLLCNK